MLDISYILHKKKKYYAIKEDPINKPKSKFNNSGNLDCCITNPSAWKGEKKQKKLEEYLRNKLEMKNYKKIFRHPKACQKIQLQKKTEQILCTKSL